MTTPDIRNLRRERARQHARWPVWVRALIALAGLYVLYLLFGYLFAPGIIKHQIEQRASAQLHRPVTVGKAVFNPFTLSVALEDLNVKDHDGQDLLGWKRLFVNLQFLALLKDEIHLSEIELDGFSTRLFVSKAGLLNVADLTSSPNSEPATAKSGKSWALRIDRLSVNAAQIDYSDESRAEPFHTHVGPTTFVLRDFRTAGGTGAPGVFSATTEAGETLAWTGRVALSPLRSNGEFRVGQLALKKYAPFYEDRVNFDVINGLIDVQAPYEFFVQNNKPEVKISEASVHIRNLALAERGQTKAFFTLPSLDVEPAAVDLQSGAVEVGKISLTGGQVAVRRDQNGLNLTRLLPVAPVSVVATQNPGAVATPVWGVNLAELNASGFALTFDDQTLPHPATLELQDLTFSAKNLSSKNLGAPITLDFQAKIGPAKGTLALQGLLTPQPLQTALKFSGTEIALTSFSPWMETFVKGRLTKGTAQIHGQAHLADSSKGFQITAGADADVTNVALTDAAGNPLAQWKSFGLHGIDYGTTPNHLGVTEVAWTEPVLSLTMGADHVLNVSTLLGQTPVPTPTAPKPTPLSPAEAAARPFISVDRFSLENANLTFVDQSIEPAVKTAISQFSGTVTGMTSAAIDHGDVNFKGLVDGAAPLSISGSANLLSEDLSADLKVSLQNSDLLPLGPYVGRFVGYRLSSGGLSLETRAKLTQRKLDSASNIVVTNFVLGEATNSPVAPHVPVHLAIALLRDSQGRIVLDIPVQGSLDDPKFQVGEVAWKLIISLITKAATSPFNLVGSVFGGGHSGEDLSFQQFAPGSTELGDQNTKKLDVLVRALQQRPAIHLAVTGSSNPAVDLPALREKAFTHRLQAAIYEEGHTIDATMTSPDQVTVGAAAEARLIEKWYQTEFMQAAAPVEKPTAPAEPPKKHFLLVRWLYRNKNKEEPETPAPTKKAPVHPSTAATPTVVLPPLAEMRARVLAAMPIADEVVTNLAKERAENVQHYVLEKSALPAERVTIESSEKTKPSTRVNLELK